MNISLSIWSFSCAVNGQHIPAPKMPRTVKHKFPNHAWELNPLLVFFGRGQVCHATNLYGQEENRSQNGPAKKLACRNLAEVFAWKYSNQNICIFIHSLKYHYIHMVGWPSKDLQTKPSFPPTYIFDFRKTVPLGHPKKSNESQSSTASLLGSVTSNQPPFVFYSRVATNRRIFSSQLGVGQWSQVFFRAT